MKIYTKTGDLGQTGLFAGARVRKDDARIEAYGTVDELNAAIGLARCEALPAPIAQTLERVQHELFVVGAELATPDPDRQGTMLVNNAQVERLEKEIDLLEAGLPPLKYFILPDGCPGGANLHVARAICRRAERRTVTLANTPDTQISLLIVTYLNRLGDYLFVAARYANQEAKVEETRWQQPGS